jgi:hypothetical protein
VWAVILVLIGLLFADVKSVFAISAPNLISPLNGSTTNNSKLTWENPPYQLFLNNPFRIQVDDNSDFSSAEKDYTTKNTYYSPSLIEGIWYWRVKTKDSTGLWSDWSNSWSFNLSSNQNSSTPTANPTSPPQQNESSPTPSTSFIISNYPNNISSNQSFAVSIDLNLPSNPNSLFYLKGAFAKSGSSNYFGQTQVNGSWIKNGVSYISQHTITTDSSGHWSGNILVMPDADDSGFDGTGSFIFKIGRYSSSGSGPSWSNETTISITAVNIPSDKSNQSTKSKATPAPTESARSNILGASSISPKSKVYLASKSSEASHEATLSSETTNGLEENTTEKPHVSPIVKGKTDINPTILIGLFFIAAGLGYLAFILIKSRV